VSEQTPLKIVDFADRNGSRDREPEGSEQDKRALSPLDRVSLVLLIIVLLLAPLCAGMFATPHLGPVPPQDILSRLQVVGVSLIGILVALATLAAVWREWQRPVAIGLVSGLAGGATLLGAWAGISLLAHLPLSHQGVNAWTMLMAALAAGGLISRLGRDRKALMVLLLVVATAGSLGAGIGVREYLEHWKLGNPSYRVFGTFVNPDFLAGYLLLTLPTTLSCFVAARERLSRLLLGLGVFLQTACLLLTGSRAGAAMLFVVIAAWLLLLWRARTLRGNGRQIGIGLALMFVSAMLASTPLLLRVGGQQRPGSGPAISASTIAAASEAQGHSGKFRQYTWTGTLRMARANLLTGTGIGSYETAYPRYATTAFTAHAHNSFLQWTAETGAPGALLLLTVLAAVSAFAAYVLFLNAPSKRSIEKSKEGSREGSKANRHNMDSPSLTLVDAEGAQKPVSSPPLLHASTPPLPYGFAEPRVLLAGLLAAVISTSLHSLFDSDWYIVATGLTLGATLGLMVAQARDLAPLATQRPLPLSRPMLAACGLVALLLLWRSVTTYLARWDEMQGLEQMQDASQLARSGQDSHARESLQSAIDSDQAAAALDPFSPEPLLSLNSLYQMSGQTDKAQGALEQATRIAPIGKTYYQLGQFLKRRVIQTGGDYRYDDGKLPPNVDLTALSGLLFMPSPLDTGKANAALNAFLQARERDPHSLQTLRALAEAYALLGRTNESMDVYRDMTALEATPLGTVRAMPEVIESEFAYAHARLAAALFRQHDLPAALTEYHKANALLHTYWTNRRNELYQALNRDGNKLRSLNILYDAVLNQLQEVLKVQGGTNAAEIAQIQAEQAQFHQEEQEDERKQEEQK
jgi:O-antigen ligase/tetratricopeptide (TPR) repeat protein